MSNTPSALEDARREHIRAIRARYYAKNAERIRVASKAWRAANPERVRETNARGRLRRKLQGADT